MLEKVNHIAIAVPDLSVAINNYKNTFNCKISKILELHKTWSLYSIYFFTKYKY